jgi:transposase-like protein
MHNLDPTPGPAGPDKRRRPGPSKRARIYKADTWHIEDGTGTDGGSRYHKNVIKRVFTPDYKLAILAEYDRCTEPGEKGAILRREGLYSSLVCDWRRQHRQGLLKAALGRTDLGRVGASPTEMQRLKTENERLRVKLAQAEAVIDVQGKVHALLEEISKSAATDESST